MRLSVPGVFCAIACVTMARAQPAVECVTANPSFEFAVPGTSQIDGWTVLGNVTAIATPCAHGQRAIEVTGPYTGAWAISALYQDLDAGPGDVFTVSVRAAHRSAEPLVGSAKGIVNVLWVDGNGNDIFYETHEVLLPGDPTDRYIARSFDSAAAPPGTAAARVFVAMLQSPAQESGSVLFDLVDCVRNAPAYDASQWNDFPGGRTVEFGGESWRVKGDGYYGPGPNWFSDDPSSVWVDADGLHMAISTSASGEVGTWSSSEIVTESPLGYGDYVFTTRGNLDAFADNVILGMFLWQYPPCDEPANHWNQNNELDVEVGRWGDPNNDNAQFVCQPWDWPGNIDRYDIDYTANGPGPDALVTYAMRWTPQRAECRAWHGGPEDESPVTMIHAWTYEGVHLPRPELPRMHINLWHTGDRPANLQNHEVVFAAFEFVPWVADANADGAITVEDMYTQARDPADLNADGVIDTVDAATLERVVRNRELEDITSGGPG